MLFTQSCPTLQFHGLQHARLPSLSFTISWSLLKLKSTGASLVAQLVKNLPAMQETWVQSLDWEDPLEKGTATHSSILAWRIPWTIYSPWGHTESHMTERLLLSSPLSRLCHSTISASVAPKILIMSHKKCLNQLFDNTENIK